MSDTPTEDLPLPSRRRGRADEDARMPPNPGDSRSVRMFGSQAFFRLWLAQVFSSLGDWIGLVAITALSNRLAGTNGVALVLSARFVPGFFFGSVGGVIVDRLDRKKVMVACDVGRGLVVGLLPFVRHLWMLFLVNLVLEGLTLLWTPAKEATVPNLVPKEHLPRVNSLSLAAAYGTFPLGGALFTALAGLATYLSQFDGLKALRVNQENLAIWTDTGTFLVSAALISSLALPARSKVRTEGDKHRIDLGAHAREVREGWRFIGHNRIVRAVLIALSCGLVGGGMVVPLGPVVAKEVLGGGPKAFGALITALGVGVAIGVVGISAVQKHFSPERIFVRSVILAGSALFLAACMWELTPALVLVGLMGVFAGVIYVIGFALIQTNTEDELRGRTFAALYAIVRLCLLLSFIIGPLTASLFGRLAKRLLDARVDIGSWTVHLSGGRIALWIGALIIVGAGLLARGSLRDHPSVTDA